jgi:hypothetical protein
MKIKLEGRRLVDARPHGNYVSTDARKLGLRKAWTMNSRKHAGEKIVSGYSQRKKRWLTEAKRHGEIQKRAQEYAWVLGIEKLAELITDLSTPPAVKLNAITVLLDRAFGKPAQVNAHVELRPTDNAELTADELDKRIEHTIREIERVKKQTQGAEAKPAEEGKKLLADLRKLN